MTARLRGWLAFALAISPVLPCFAGSLKWEVRERQVSASAGGEPVVVKFPFVNVGAGPVSITGVETGCICTSAKPSKAVYAAGESGELLVEFTIGGRVGRQDRQLTVATGEPGEQPQELRLVVDIAELAAVRPRLIFWTVAAPAAAKSAMIHLARPAQTRLLPPTCPNPDFALLLTPTARPDTFELQITPLKTTVPTTGVVRVEAVIDGKTHALTVFAAVR